MKTRRSQKAETPEESPSRSKPRKSRARAASTDKPQEEPQGTKRDSSSKRRRTSSSGKASNATSEPAGPVNAPAPEKEQGREEQAPGMEGGAGDKKSPQGDRKDAERSDGEGSSGRNLATSALQGLLRKLTGSGLEGAFPHHAFAGPSKLRTLLATLKSEPGDGQTIECLTELCEVLSMGTEESMSSFSVEQFVPVLVELLNAEHNPDIMLLSTRALTHLMDALPQACGAIAHFGAVPIFCSRLLTIEYIDLAEQSLQAIEKLSHEHPSVVLRAGGLMASLSYLDFFATGVQRVAVSTAANLCRHVPQECFEMVSDSLPNLSNLLQYHDQRIVESACIAFSRLADSFADSDQRLQQISSHGFTENVLPLLSPATGPSQLSPATYTAVVRTLGVLAHGSPVISQRLLDRGITSVLLSNLASEALSASPAVGLSPAAPVGPPKSTELVYEVLSLANALLPPLPRDVADSFAMAVDEGTADRLAIRRRQLSRGARPSPDGEEGVDGEASRRAREAIFRENPQLLVNYAECLFSTLVSVFNSSANSAVRQKCLTAIARVVFFLEPRPLESLLRNVPISSFVAGLIASSESAGEESGGGGAGSGGAGFGAAVAGLHLAEVLMAKLPDVFRFHLRREGVVHEIDRLLAACDEPPRSRRPPTDPRGKAVALAREFRERYFPEQRRTMSVGAGEEIDESADTDAMKSFRRLAARLTQTLNSDSAASVEAYGQLLAGIRDIISGRPSVAQSDESALSTFEFSTSGVIPALLAFLTRKGDAAQRQLRLAAFSAAFCAHDGARPLLQLVRLLEAAASAQERFPIVLYDAPAGSPTSASGAVSSLRALTQPFKLRLERAPDERRLRDYSANVVLIEPLATIGAIEDFLWPKVRMSSPAPPPPPPPPPPASAAPAEGEGDKTTEGKRRPSAGSRSASRKGEAPSEMRETRSMSRKRSASKGSEGAAKADGGEEAAAAAPPPERAEQEDEEEGDGGDEGMEDDGYIEDDYEEDEGGYDGGYPGEGDEMDEEGDEEPHGGEEEEAEPAHAARRQHPHRHHEERVQDVDVEAAAASAAAASAAAGRSAPAAPRAPARQAASRSGRRRRPPAGSSAAAPQRRLSFYMDGQLVSFGTTIFQAVQRCAARRAAGGAQSSSAPPAAPSRSSDDSDEHSEEASGGPSGSAPPAAAAAPAAASQLEPLGPRLHLHYKEGYAGDAADAAASDSLAAEAAPGAPGGLPAAPSDAAAAEWALARGDVAPSSMAGAASESLRLLRLLDAINRLPEAAAHVPPGDALHRSVLPPAEFVNAKLTAKLLRQLQDPLALCSGTLPAWCGELVHGCPALFSLEARRAYLYSTAFGTSRALHHFQQQQQQHGAHAQPQGRERERDGDPLRLGRLQRQKVRISRERMLESALKVMDLYGSSKAVLEVEYFNEAGTGLGPTLEFYTLVSHELQRRDLGMWRDVEEVKHADHAGAAEEEDEGRRLSVSLDRPNSAYVMNRYGLYPGPLPPPGPEREKLLSHFTFLGRFVGKAIQDQRLVDLHLSAPFLQLVVGSRPLTRHDLAAVDPGLHASLEKLRAVAAQRAALLADASLSDAERAARAEALTVDGATVEALCLDFTAPGRPALELVPEGRERAVTLESLDEYLAAVEDHLLGSGVAQQVEAVRAGLAAVLPVRHLRPFDAAELDLLLCGHGEKWDIPMLGEHTKCDHGYSHGSRAVKLLLEVLAEMSAEEQRHFLRFVTGSPRLPVGGLASLRPKLTIVRRNPDGNHSPDDYLPTVMTCANYLKLPDYSSKEIMRARLAVAIREGQGSFHLS
eukprot:tig00020554_g10820.t1